MNHLLTDILKHLTNIGAMVTALLVLSGCNGEACLEPDDFGFARATVSSRYDPINGQVQIFGPQSAEITPWRDNGLTLNGLPLYIEVKNWTPGVDENTPGILSAWCPWYGDKGQDGVLSNFCSRLDPCNFKGEENCYDANFNFTSNACVKAAFCTSTVNAQITNAPCLMTKGIGLYALISKQQYNPNLSLGSMSNPSRASTVSMHLGDPHVGYSIPSIDSRGNMANAGGVLYDYDGNHTSNSDRLAYVNGKLYLKIMDHFYEDNNGHYRVVIKSGVVNGGWDPISWCINLVKTALFGNGSEAMDYTNSGVIPAIYKAVVANSGFVDTVRAMMTLFVLFSAIGFVIGSIELTQKELLDRIFSVILMVALISPHSWDFFNEHVFIWFYAGTDFVINILYQVAASGPGSTNPLDFFFSYEIFVKLFSLLFATPTGWIFIIVYLIMLVYIVKIFFDAAVLYMTALIMMGVLISIAPIFIMLLLFEQTKSFFNNWVKQITAYSIQMILVYAGILFMTMIIRNQIYNTLGFPVCSTAFPNTPIGSLFQLYFPKIASQNPAHPSVIPVPKDHFQTSADAAINSGISSLDAIGNASAVPFGFAQVSDPKFCLQNPTAAPCANGNNPNVLTTNIANPNVGAFCSAYECLGYRYPDLPFLDPNDPYENTLINQIRAGYIGDFGGLAIIVVCVFLMDHFNQSAVSMSKGLSDTLNNSGNAADAASRASTSFHAAAMQGLKAVDKRTLGVSAKVGAARDKVHDFFAKQKYDLIDKPWADHKINSLRNDALQEPSLLGNLKSVTKSAEASSGITHSEALEFKNNVKTGAYATNLANAINTSQLGSAAGGGTGAIKNQDAATNILKNLSAGKAEDFHDISSQELFKGKRYEALSASDKTLIDNLATHSSVASILSAKQQQEKFQDAYVESYIQMSDEGRGFLQKRSSLLRGYSDLKETIKENARKDQEDRLLQREKFDSLFGGSVRGDQIRYDNEGLRTNNELLSDKAQAKVSREISNKLNKETLSAGRDIQRADFNADDRQKALIEEYVRTSTKEALKSELMGETYMKTKMNDRSMKSMIDKLRLKEKEILESDQYLQDRGQYAGNGLAMQKLAEREQMIRNVVDSEINHINEIRSSRGMPPYVGYTEMDGNTGIGIDQALLGNKGIDNELLKDMGIDDAFNKSNDAAIEPDKNDKFKLTADDKPLERPKPPVATGRGGGTKDSAVETTTDNVQTSKNPKRS